MLLIPKRLGSGRTFWRRTAGPLAGQHSSIGDEREGRVFFAESVAKHPEWECAILTRRIVRLNETKLSHGGRFLPRRGATMFSPSKHPILAVDDEWSRLRGVDFKLV
jgi:hypothetical protein